MCFFFGGEGYFYSGDFSWVGGGILPKIATNLQRNYKMLPWKGEPYQFSGYARSFGSDTHTHTHKQTSYYSYYILGVWSLIGRIVVKKKQKRNKTIFIFIE